MSLKITEEAAKVIKFALEQEENKGLALKVFVTQNHGDHAHYGLDLVKSTITDQVVTTDEGFKVIIDLKNPFLRSIKIDYQEGADKGFMITNTASRGHRH